MHAGSKPTPRVAALLVALSLLGAPLRPAFAVGANPGSASPVQREQAQAKFLKGRDLFAAKKYAEAVIELRASMEIVQSPNARLYVARALREQGKLLEAYVEFGRTAVEADELAPQDARYAKTAASAKLERKEIAPKLGFVNVTIEHPEASTILIVGGEEVKRAGWSEPVPVAPGTTELEVRTEGKSTLKKSVTLGPGEKTTVTIDAAEAKADAVEKPVKEPTKEPEAPSSGSGLRVGGFVAGGVGLVGFGLFAGFGLAARSKFNDLETACAAGCPTRTADIDAGKRDQRIANIGLVVGLVGVATSVTLFVLSRRGSATTQVGFTPTGVFVGGSF